MPIDLRILFLIFAALAGLLFLIRTGGPPVSLVDLGQIFLDFLLVPVTVLAVLTFAAILARQDPLPMVREVAYLLSFQHLISFEQGLPANLEDNLAVKSILRQDTDGDEFAEWVVFYKFDTRETNSPIQAVIYDNDRGSPPVFFPYALRPPDRDYVSEDSLIPPTFELEDIAPDQDGPQGESLPELIVSGQKELSVFRFRENSEPWDFPRDAPPRYQPVGFFRASGGVTIDLDDNIGDVTVLDRDGFERSQLAVRSVYRLNPQTATYWDRDYGPTELNRQLAAPFFSTVDFFAGPPNDILDTAFPEKVVLAFYISTCGGQDESLCTHAPLEWLPEDFLTGDALAEFDAGNTNFFGLSAFGATQDLAVGLLRYQPGRESDIDLLQLGGGRDVVTGEEGQLNVVDISFTANGSPIRDIRYRMVLREGRWKIFAQLTPPSRTPLGPSNELETPIQP